MYNDMDLHLSFSGARGALNLPHVAQPAWKYINHFNSKHNSIVLTFSIFISCSVFLYSSNSIAKSHSAILTPSWQCESSHTWTHTLTLDELTATLIALLLLSINSKPISFSPIVLGLEILLNWCVYSACGIKDQIYVFLYSLLQFILECITKSDP